MSKLKNAWPALLILTAAALVLVRYFEDFPNGWDQTEYAWCLQSNYLPHSPYLVFFLLAKGLSLFFAPPVALSLLAAASGLASLALFASIARILAGNDAELPARNVGLVAMALLGFTYLFIRQCATQEVYAPQLLMVLAALRLALIPRPGAAVASGAVFGLALCTHNATLFLLPAFALAWWQSGAGKPVRAVVAALVPAGAVVAVFAALVFVLVPPPPGASRAVTALNYLQGISAAKPELAAALEAATPTPGKRDVPALLAKSVECLYQRLTDLHIPHTRLPIATGPVGFSPAHYFLALGGLALAFRHCRRAAVFWLAYAGPYFAYEAAKSNPDYGVYLPFLLPPMAFVLAVAVAWTARRIGARIEDLRARVLVTVAATLAVLAPSLTLAFRHRNDPKTDLVENYSPLTLGMSWMGGNLPTNAVVIQPLAEWNGNRMPYYLAGRRHVARVGGRLLLFSPRGRFTPMNLTAYEPLTTAGLEELIRAGHPVYALEPDPLNGVGDMDAGRFTWSETRTAEGSGASAPFAFYRAAVAAR